MTLFTAGVLLTPIQAYLLRLGLEHAGVARDEPVWWLADNYAAITFAQMAVFAPLWFFALASMRPLLGIAVWVIYYGWTFFGSVALTPESLWAASAAAPNGGIQMLVQVGLLATIAIVLLRAPLVTLSIELESRRIARPLPPVRSTFGLLRTMFGVWPNLRRSTLAALASTLLMYIATTFTSLNILVRVSFALGFVTGIPALLSLVFRGISYGEPIAIFAPLVGLGLLFLGVALVAIVLRWLGQSFRQLARGASRQSLETQIARDKRAPILFLRSFADDQVSLPQAGFWARFLRGEAKERRLDHLLVEQFTRYGPVVAIGRPGEKDLPFGAARR